MRIVGVAGSSESGVIVKCSQKGVGGAGRRSPDGFQVFLGSRAGEVCTPLRMVISFEYTTGDGTY